VSGSTLIVSQALIQHQDGVSLHPDLFLWTAQLAGYRQRWFECDDKNPLAWYAALCDISPAALLAARCENLPDDAVQCWVASPYHGQLARNHVHVLPEGQFPWNAADANALCETLNPLLAEDGMQLFAVGAALLMACREPIEAYPSGFAAISGQLLPDRDHEGADGGRLNRLLSEIQMLLFQHPSWQRHEQGLPDVNGLWLWSPATLPLHAPAESQRAIATRNPTLQSMVNGKDARIMISEAERLAALLQQDAPLPKRILLAGQGYGVWLTKSLLRRFAKSFAPQKWQPKSVHHEAPLLSILRTMT